MSQSNEQICDLLATLPPNYPVNSVVVDGVSQETTNFIVLDNRLAYFRNGADTKTFSCTSIEGLDF